MIAIPRLALSLLLILGLAAAPVDAKRKKKRQGPPPAPESFESAFFSIDRPPGEGWLLLGGDDRSFVRDGAGDPVGHRDDSWAARILIGPRFPISDLEGLRAAVESEYRDVLEEHGLFCLLDQPEPATLNAKISRRGVKPASSFGLTETAASRLARASGCRRLLRGPDSGPSPGDPEAAQPVEGVRRCPGSAIVF